MVRTARRPGLAGGIRGAALCGLAILALAAPAAPQAPPGAAAPRWPALDGGGSYVLFLARGVTLVNGGSQEFKKASALRTTAEEQLFWFQHGGKEYLIRDAALLQQLQSLFEAPMSLGTQQAALASQLEKLAGQLSAIDAQQKEQAEQQTEFGSRMAELAAEQVQLQEQSQSTEDVEAQIRGVEADQERLEGPQTELADQRYALEQDQRILAGQQQELGRRLEQATQEAERKLAALVDQAIEKGTAKPVK